MNYHSFERHERVLIATIEKEPGATATRCAAAIGRSHNLATKYLRRLRAQGRVICTRHGRELAYWIARRLA